MSSDVTTIFRHQGTFVSGLLTLGMVKEIFYDPATYNADPARLAAAMARLRDYPMQPAAGGVIVLDLDGKHRWDMQRLLNLDLLSGEVDARWAHHKELRRAQWIAKGLFRADGTMRALSTAQPANSLDWPSRQPRGWRSLPTISQGPCT